MATLLVVEHVGVVEQLFIRDREALAQLALEHRVPALHRRIVVTVAATAHRAGGAVCGEDVLVVLAYPAPLRVEATYRTVTASRGRWMSMAEKPQEDPQHWIAKRRVALVVSILKGETNVSERRVCRILHVPRAACRTQRAQTPPKLALDEALTEHLRRLILEHPTSGCRRLWAHERPPPVALPRLLRRVHLGMSRMATADEGMAMRRE